jgi:acyl-CoA reductase-like NAD-dependent aldehyde dehydrogenase
MLDRKPDPNAVTDPDSASAGADAKRGATVELKPEATAELRIKPGCEWKAVVAALRAATPEAFGADGALLNCVAGAWGTPGKPHEISSAVDGTKLGSLPMLDAAGAMQAVHDAAHEAPVWSRTPLAERTARVRATLDGMRSQREALVKSLMWEIGKPHALAASDVDRCIEGVAWYCDSIEPMLRGRTPLGLVSNIASWNYPLSVLVHATLVQALAGNSVIAKTPTDGGGLAIGVCVVLARRAGVPISLVSGPGGPLSQALIRHELIDCVSFVGGRATGRDIALNLVDTSKRFMLEMEGVNAWGVWDFSQWDVLAGLLRKGYEYAKQRCTAYPRFVVQRRLLPRFIDTYLGVVKGLRFGNPFAVARDEDALPVLEFGPLINAKKVKELRGMWDEALVGGAMPIYEGALASGRFITGQDTGAYMAPACLLGLPRSSRLYHGEPFGPLDSIIVVDSVEQMIAEMNVSNGNLVASVATDDAGLAERLRGELRAFKVGHNAVRSRGDRQEPFGGMGQSWKGCFVGGKHLVHAVTRGDGDDRLAGNFREVFRMPSEI